MRRTKLLIEIKKEIELEIAHVWDPLRGDPRFEKIVTSLAPKKP